MSKKSVKSLADSVEKIPFVGKQKAAAFDRLGIKSVEDLLGFIPRALADFSVPRRISQLTQTSGKSPILASVSQIKGGRTFRRGMSITRALLSDQSGSIEAVWFNQPYLKKTLLSDKKYLFWGEARRDKYSQRIVFSNPEFFPRPGIYPIYPQTRGLTSRQISRVIKNALEAGYRADEYLSERLIKQAKLAEMTEALEGLHFPRSVDEFKRFKNRIIFNKLLELILANKIIKADAKTLRANKIDINRWQNKIDEFIAGLPFSLTRDQFSAIGDIMSDYQKGVAMNRLVQGDVGSGKTIVALAVCLPVVWSGQKAVWLAPTQVLASQHYQNISAMVGDKITLALQTAGVKRGDIHKADLIIGTHALLEKKVAIKKLGLVIVDEQHRFGVKQREKLKISAQKNYPHFLSLTATPIPRTLSHIIFGNCDISIIATKPPGRQTIKTYIVPESKREKSYEFIRRLVGLGQKVFIICPAIGNEFDLEIDKKAVTHEVERVKNTALGDCQVLALHGQMKAKEKSEIFEKFAHGGGEVLVSTSVVEVGVDVPKATVMVVEDAHAFGLAQLHQFRGRVGRRELQSYCFCFSQNLDNPKTKMRLGAFVRYDDGFKLAEYDLKLRGPGALVGLEQSGFSDINPAWLMNVHLLALSKKIADENFADLIDNEILYNKVKANLKTTHLE